MSYRPSLVSFLLVLSASMHAASKAHPQAAPRDSNAERIRAYFFSQDYASGLEESAALEKAGAASAPLVAWRIVNQASLVPEGAHAALDSLAAWPGGSEWARFAKAFVLSRDADSTRKATALARSYLRTHSPDPDARWLYAYALQRDRQYANVVRFVDSLGRQPVRLTAELLVVKGTVLAAQWTQRKDSVLRQRAREAFEAARRLDPANVNAYYLAVSTMPSGLQDSVNFELLARAAVLAPSSGPVQQYYWQMLNSRPGMPLAERRSLIVQAAESVVARRPGSPSAMRLAAIGLQIAKEEMRAAEYTRRITAEFSGSPEAEYLLHEHIRELGDSIYRKQLPDTADGRARHRRLVTEFLARPRYINAIWRGNVLMHLFDYYREDPSVHGDSLTRFVRRFATEKQGSPNTTHLAAPLLLLDRGGDVALAERLVIAGEPLRAAQLRAVRGTFATVGEYANARDVAKASTLDARGWVAFHRGHLLEAKRLCGEARELTNRSPSVFYHLGRIAEAEGRVAEAKLLYIRGFIHEGRYTGWNNRAAITRLYVADHRSAEGVDNYFAQLKEEERSDRRARIVEARDTTNRVILPFALSRLGAPAERVTQSVATGKVTVLNFWGVWCGPCVQEIPQIQQFYDGVKNDPDVVFLTVDFQDERETLNEFVMKRKLTFPVLIDEKKWVADRARIIRFPTTWFFDRSGKLVYEHRGASEAVVEEFLWRVEVLKKARPTP